MIERGQAHGQNQNPNQLSIKLNLNVWLMAEDKSLQLKINVLEREKEISSILHSIEFFASSFKSNYH